MSCEAFIAKKFQAKTLALVGEMNGIIASYTARGFVLTVRQLYYQLVPATSSKIGRRNTTASNRS